MVGISGLSQNLTSPRAFLIKALVSCEFGFYFSVSFYISYEKIL